MKIAISIILKVIVLTVIQFICFAAASAVIGQQESRQSAEQAGDATVPLLTVCFLSTIVLTHIILRSRWTGWRLIAIVFLIYYGVMTFLPQIESAVFITRLPPGMLSRLFLMGALIAAPFAIFAVLILRKKEAEVVNIEPNSRLVMPAKEWAWKLAVVASVYLILYFGFGYFVAWQNPAVREYYNGPNVGSFFAHMRWVVEHQFWLIPFQILRSMLWLGIALPVIRMMKGPWRETAMALGLLFAVPLSQLLIPNPYMPEEVRMSHLLETASSNFIFGFFIGWLLTRRKV
jgi:hypothetical protein